MLILTCIVNVLLREQHAGVALSALIRALNELQMVAIVRYAYNRTSNPQVGAAFPCIKQDSEVRSTLFFMYIFTTSVAVSTGLTMPLSPFVVPDVRPAAVHGRPQTFHVSFS